MKIINVDINDEIIFKNVLDVDTGVITGISSSVKLPTGNYNNIILNFSFANHKLCDEFHIFANFKINNNTPIVQELVPMELGSVNYTHTCYIPNEVFQEKCEVALGVYGYRLNEDETLDKRFSLVPVRNFVIEGSYDPDTTESIVPTPTVFEIYFNKIEKAEADCQAMLEQTAIEVDNKLNAIQTDYNTFKAEKDAEVNNFLNNAEGQFMGTVNQLEAEFEETQTKVNQMQTTVDGAETKVNNMENTLNTTLPLKQDKLTFDSTPTSGSTNPVTSAGIFSAIASERVVTGSYSGDGTTPRNIDLGFKPSAIIIGGRYSSTFAFLGIVVNDFFCGYNVCDNSTGAEYSQSYARPSISENGISISGSNNSSSSIAMGFNVSGANYRYIAFK